MDQKFWELLSEMRRDMAEIKESQVRTEVDIAHHIKRTDDLESWVKAQDARLKSIETPYNVTVWLVKFAGGAGAVLSVAYTLKELLK